MNKSELERGQDLLVLRFSANIKKECIEEHQKVINDFGYCWFGKLGNVPNSKMIRSILSAKNPAILLYTKGEAYLCNFREMITTEPQDGCPSYYQDECIYPRCYFKLTSIEKTDISILESLFVRSSRRRLSDVFSHQCMSSFLFVANEEIKNPGPEISIEKDKKEKRDLLDKNDCKYRRTGVCTLKTCISYQYECERPSMCAKQKR